MKHLKAFKHFVESISKSSYSTLKRNDIIKHTDSDIMLRISVSKPKVSGVILNSGMYKGKPIRIGDVIEIKLAEINEWEMSSLDESNTINEGVWAKIMKGVKSGDSGPWSIIATDGSKVVGQDIDIKSNQLIPAHYEDMKKKYPKAKIHIEDAGGGVVWSE
jgi:hypothetical protein